jgi:hypothetical protein
MVVEMDNKLVAWKQQLPAYFSVDDPELSLDDSHTFLPWHRLYLHSAFHFARITLHRPHLLRESITNRFGLSHEACISSASSDLKIRLQSLNYGTAENMRWTLGTHNMFNSAFILGIIAVRRPNAPQTAAILNDLEEYCERLRKDVWLNEFGLAEVKVVELCIIRTRGFAQATEQPSDKTPISPPEVLPDFMIQQREGNSGMSTTMNIAGAGMAGSPSQPPVSSPDMMWPAVWEDQNFAFPQAADLETWEQMISEIAYHT